MIILALKTEQAEAELWLYDSQEELSHIKWPAHLQLAETINTKINKILDSPTPLRKGMSSISLEDIEGIVCFKGPGSFTGLRIGLSVANALAYAQNIPIVARANSDWLEVGIKDLLSGKNDKITTPLYDRPAAVTPPRK